ncbi:MAG: hypothetical protein HY278_00990 [candidate division NC10 bacterium]|nr:hypothetical protein [candidate division NC10 bacterium]
MSFFFVFALVSASAWLSSSSSISIVILMPSPNSAKITVVGSDLTFRNSVVAPTLKIRRMIVAGH